VPLRLLHALVNHPARTMLVNANPETRIVLSAVAGAGMRMKLFPESNRNVAVGGSSCDGTTKQRGPRR
jgi:hypothetical protein